MELERHRHSMKDWGAVIAIMWSRAVNHRYSESLLFFLVLDEWIHLVHRNWSFSFRNWSVWQRYVYPPPEQASPTIVLKDSRNHHYSSSSVFPTASIHYRMAQSRTVSPHLFVLQFGKMPKAGCIWGEGITVHDHTFIELSFLPNTAA